MAVLKKTLLRSGIYESPQGRLVASPRRVQRWVDQFNAMKKAGIQVPVAWGHQPEAEPGNADERSERQYWLSKLNAGYVRDLTFDRSSGDLGMSIDVPGAEVDSSGNLVTLTTLPDGRSVKSAVGEVSAAIKNWKDGTGKTWQDSIIHVALTPLPVVAHQDGFSLSTQSQDGVIYLSLSSLRTRELGTEGGKPVADEKDDEMEPKDDDAPDPAEEKSEVEVPLAEPEPAVVPEIPTEEATSLADFKKALDYLRGRDIHLPEDTSPDNFVERLCVACHAIEGHEAANPEEPTEPTPGMGGTDGGQVTEQAQPTTMMSLSTAKTTSEKKLFGREQTRHRKELGIRIDRLVKRGMPVDEANILRPRVAGYELGLTADGDVVQRPIEIELSIWEKALPKAKFRDDYLLNNATEQPRPDVDGDEKSMAKLASEHAKRVSRVS